MISFLRGRVIETHLTSLVVDVNGLGYEVTVAPEIASSATKNLEIELFTALVVREDAWTLFGFRNSDARNLFHELQSVTGVGPKVAHSLLSFFRPDELRIVIGDGSAKSLEQVPGIGKKVASRIILELKDRYPNAAHGRRGSTGKWREDLLQALIGLGYSSRQAEAAVDAMLGELEVEPASLEIAELLRLTLVQTRVTQ